MAEIGRGRRSRAVVPVVVAALVAAGSVAITNVVARAASSSPRLGEAAGSVRQSAARLPVSFEPNQGQTDPQVKFLSRRPGSTLFLTGNEAVLAVAGSPGEGEAHEPGSAGLPATPGAVLRMRLVGADPGAPVVGRELLAGRVNYLEGAEPGRWHTEIPTYGRVAYQGVYPGIDLAWYGRQGELEYDFVVAPGADPTLITLGFAGAEGLRLDDQGDLVLGTAAGPVRHHRPVLYQEVAGLRRPVEGRFEIRGPDQVGFAVGPYDRGLPLVVDPVLTYSTHLGGTGYDQANAIAVDGGGNAYLTGTTCSADFPVANPLQSFAGPACGSYDTAADAFVAKLNPQGSALVYSTFLGGGGFDIGNGIAVDSAGSAYVTGDTGSANFPTASPPGTTPYRATLPGRINSAFVAKLNPQGSGLVYATYLGGSNEDDSAAIALGPNNTAYVTGTAHSADFPVTRGAFQTTCRPRGSFPCYDAFVTKLNAQGTRLAYSTFLGGSDLDNAKAITVDGNGRAYVAGQTTSADFPTTANAFQPAFAGPALDDGTRYDAFVVKIKPDPDDPNSGAGDADDLVYSTYLGGAEIPDDTAVSFGAGGHDRALGIDLGPGNRVYVVGATSSGDFPVTPGAFQTTPRCSEYDCDAFVTKLDITAADPAGQLVYSTYLGGGNDEVRLAGAIAVDAEGNAVVTGDTNSSSFPVTADAIQGRCCFTSVAPEVFVTKLAPDPDDPNGGTGDPSDLLFSTFLGGSGQDVGTAIALDSSGAAYVAGYTNSPGRRNPDFYGTRPKRFPTTTGAFQPRLASGTCFETDLCSDAFVSKISGL